MAHEHHCVLVPLLSLATEHLHDFQWLNAKPGNAMNSDNILLLGLVCWAVVDQYPHPEEEGVVAFTVLTVLTPILSAVVLFRTGRRSATRQP